MKNIADVPTAYIIFFCSVNRKAMYELCINNVLTFKLAIDFR